MLDIQNISKSFKGSPAVRNLSLQVKKGEIMGLLGANGAGKSTTINMILGFLPPDNGKIYVNNLEVSLKIEEVRKQLGYISTPYKLVYIILLT